MACPGVPVKLKYLDTVLNKNVRTLGGVFASNGYTVRLVGGVVRDLLLEKVPHDVDLATDANPDQMIDVLSKAKLKVVSTGLKHGTVTAVMDKEHYEITSLRIDAETDGRHAKVLYTHDWKLDAERRDLTINAMSLDLDGRLYDYFNGHEHLKARKVLFVNDPNKRIQEDYLRILRYFRFHGRIAENREHDEATLQAIRNNACGLQRVSGERMWLELSRLLVGPNAESLMVTMYDTGVAEEIGLPSGGRDKIPTFEQVRKSTTNPVSVLVALLEHSDEFMSLVAKWKLSGKERKLGLYLCEQRNWSVTHKLCTDELVSSVEKNHVLELARYSGNVNLATELTDWPIPLFPVTGRDLLMKGVKKGPQLGDAMKSLKRKWMESNYVLTTEELLRTL